MGKKHLLSTILLSIIVAFSGFELGLHYQQLVKPRSIRCFIGAATEVPSKEIVELFEKETGISVIASYSGSGKLLSAIILSETGDVYAPGSQDYMGKAAEKGVIYEDTVTIIAYLVPAIIVPKGNPKNITCLEDLAKPGVRVGIGDPESVCVGGYAKDLLEYNGLWDAVKPNIVVYAESCSKTAALPVTGAVDAIIGWHVFYYWNTNKTEIVWIRPDRMPKIAYVCAAVCRYTEDYDAAKKFIEFYTSDEAKEVLRKYHYFATVEEAKVYAPNATVPSWKG